MTPHRWSVLSPQRKAELVALHVLRWEPVAAGWYVPASQEVTPTLPAFAQHWNCALALAREVAGRGERQVNILLGKGGAAVRIIRPSGDVVAEEIGAFPDALCRAALVAAGVAIE